MADNLTASMTSPVREALETAPTVIEQLERVLPRLKEDIVASFAIGCAIDTLRALSAAPGEPCAWRYRDPRSPLHPEKWHVVDYKPDHDGSWIVEPLYTTPQPAAGWDEAISAVLAIVNAERKSCSSHFGIVMAAKLDRKIASLRREAPAPADGVTEHVATVIYTNYRGDTAVRTIVPRAVRYGSTKWHPEPQWLLIACDCNKRAEREFALKDFGSRPDTAEARLREAVVWLDAEIVRASTEQRNAYVCGHDRLGGQKHSRHCALVDVKQKLEALSTRDEAKESGIAAQAAPSAVGRDDGPMPHGPATGDGQPVAAVGSDPATATNSEGRTNV